MKILKHLGFSLALCALTFFVACSHDDATVTPETPQIDTNYLQIPIGFDDPYFPPNNPYSAAKFELGRMLFYEKILSKDSSIQSCSHCMKQEHAFTDGKVNPLGFGGEVQFRNGMPVTNASYRKIYFWDGRGNAIETTALRSIWMPDVFASDTNDINRRLQSHPLYPALFKRAFGENAVPQCYLVAQAIATFVRCMISGNSPFDKYTRGDSSALSESQVRGMKLFFSPRTNCSFCHSGIMFTDQKFHNTGTQRHYWDRGREYVTGNPSDYGLFLTPSLRNVEVTGPWMSDGAYSSLEEIIENYNNGGKLWSNKDQIIKPLGLSSQEKNDIIAFLKSLTDREFLGDKRFSDPFKK